MNTPVTPAGQCPFHAQLKEKGENFDMFGAAYQTDPAEALKEFREELLLTRKLLKDDYFELLLKRVEE